MITIIPTPKICDEKEGKIITFIPAIHTDEENFLEKCNSFIADFKKLTDCELEFKKGGIELKLDSSLKCDSYYLDCTQTGIILSASSDEGMFYALASLTQILDVSENGIICPEVHIEDYPDKEYRSIMIDLGRYWHPACTLYKYIDTCYMYKVKYLHLHFCDNLLYTIPSKAFPKLNKPGKFYSEDDIKALNEYAKKRGVFLIPEFECPGHAPILVQNYPEIFGNDFSSGINEEAMFNEAGFKIPTDSLICAGSEKCFEATKTLLKEICDLFPDAPYINIGGDEANISLWNYCADCKKYMEENNISNENELYADYLVRIINYIFSLGKTPIVWEGFSDEYANLIPKETIVIAWEALYNLPQNLLKKGFRIINASWKPLYLVDWQMPGKATTAWDCYDILSWNIYNWQNWFEHSKAFLNPITVQPTDMVLGSMYCSWGQTYEQEIGPIMEKLGAASERTWTVKRVISDMDYLKKKNKIYPLISRLVQDV